MQLSLSSDGKLYAFLFVEQGEFWFCFCKHPNYGEIFGVCDTLSLG